MYATRGPRTQKRYLLYHIQTQKALEGFFAFKSPSDTLNLDECLKAAFEAKNEENNCRKGLPMPRA